MANALIDFSTTAGNNTTVGTANIAENCAPSGLNNAARQIIAYEVQYFLDSNTIASATTTDLGTIKEGYVSISGTTTITAFGTPTNKTGYWLKFDGALTLTHNATSLILPSGANIVTAAGDIAYAKHEGSGNWRVLVYQRATGAALVTVAQTLPANYLSGLEIANNSGDANNDIDFAVGKARNSADTVDMTLAGALTKRLDASWAVGTNQGGLFSGSKTLGTWYHCFLIRRSDTGVVDCGFDTSLTAANIPANYDAYRYLGSIRTDASNNILAFTARGNTNYREWWFSAPVLDIDATNPGTSAVSRTLTTPLGRATKAFVNLGVFAGSGTNIAAYLSDLATQDIAVQVVGTATAATPGASMGGGPATIYSWASWEGWTNVSSQIRSRLSLSDGNTHLAIVTKGWADTL